jgi:hypothetical protein
MSPDEMIEVIQAYKDGKVVQFRYKRIRDSWSDADPTGHLEWNFGDYDYRVKLAPKVPREIWVNYYCKGFEACVHNSKSKADQAANFTTLTECVHFIEVIDKD